MNRHITESIVYTGMDDPNADFFEAQYPLTHGMSYNSYVIMDEKIAIMDSVEARLGTQWLQRVEETVGDRHPEYIVVHHMEPDHSASLLKALDRWPGLKIVASAKAIGMLGQFFPSYDFSERTISVKEGDTLELGRHTLVFYSAPMIHWPEVMVTYESSEHILFSADAFGKFGALQYGDEWVNEARRYYMNIVGKYGAQVQSLLRKLAAPPISMIAPLHGPVLRGNLTPYLRLYDKWSRYEPECRGVLVAYASIYGGTARAANILAGMLREENAGDVTVLDLSRSDMSEAVAQAFRCSSMVVAAPTYDAALFPVMYDFLHHLALKNYRNRNVGIIENGSWAPISGRLMRGMLDSLPGISFVEPVVTVRSRVNDGNILQLHDLARSFGSLP